MRELSLNVMDIVQNSISAKATLIEIEIVENPEKNTLSITIADNGRGMNKEQLRQVNDPFYTTRNTRSVGLGVPLFKMEAEMTGGYFTISSEEGQGTKLSAVFMTNSIDMIPLGDIDSVVHLLITCNPEIDFSFVRRLISPEECQVKLDSREIKEILGEGASLSLPEVVEWLKSYLEEQTQEYLNQVKSIQ